MHGHFYSFAAYRKLPTSPRRNSLPPPSHQYSGNIQRLFTNNPKIFKDFSSTTRKYSDFFACRIVSAENHQYPGNIQRLSGQQQQPAAAITCSNQQQQSAAATSSSDQHHRSTAATSSSNQQQQPAAAISSSNQQQRPAFILPAAPTQPTSTSVSYQYGS